MSFFALRGVSAEFFKKEMTLSDLSVMIHEYQEQERQRMEEWRMGLYYAALPALNHKKVKCAGDLFRFSWEGDRHEIRTECTEVEMESVYRACEEWARNNS